LTCGGHAWHGGEGCTSVSIARLIDEVVANHEARGLYRKEDSAADQ
jgi:hypothetical protein